MNGTELKIFLEQEVLKGKIKDIKQFGKGQFPVFYLKLENGEELTIKFYASQKNADRALNILLDLGENPALKIPRVYSGQRERFVYQGYYGIILNFVEGQEISASRLNSTLFQEIVDMYEQFQKSQIKNVVLGQEKTVPEYIKQVREEYLTQTSNANGLISRWLLDLAKFIASKVVNDIEAEYKACSVDIPRKLVHRDITKSNMLFNEGHFAAFIDMDSVCYSWVGRDFAEFIVSSVLHYPVWKSKCKSIKEWYRIIDVKFGLSFAEYKYGLDIYYLYRLQRRLMQYQTKLGFCKFCNFLVFLFLRKYILKVLCECKKN